MTVHDLPTSYHTEIPLEQLHAEIAQLRRQLEAKDRQLTTLRDSIDRAAGPGPCIRKLCTYYTEYLEFGPTKMDHRQYHHDRHFLEDLYKWASGWIDRHPTAQATPYDRMIFRLERLLHVQ